MGNFVYKALTTGVKLTEILEGKFESSATYPKMEEKKAALHNPAFAVPLRHDIAAYYRKPDYRPGTKRQETY